MLWNMDSPCTFLPNRKPDPSTGYIKNRAGHSHRLVWIEHNGPIPDGMIVGHICHDEDESCAGGRTCPHRACVNIEHLALMTTAENTRAAARNMNRGLGKRKEFCKRGHPRTPDNLYANGACRKCAGILKFGKETDGRGSGSRGRGRPSSGQSRSR